MSVTNLSATVRGFGAILLYEPQRPESFTLNALSLNELGISWYPTCTIDRRNEEMNS
jgi:hypothetical protein